MTRVVFKVLDGSVIALFPDDSECDSRIGSYAQVGQHSPADIELLTELIDAQVEQYQSLYNELIRIGYELQIVKG